MEDEFVRVIKCKKDSLMVKMVEVVKFGEVDGCVLVGNIGVLMLVGLFIVGCIKGVVRLVLVVILLMIDGKGFVFLDVGVNVDVKFEYLL